MGIGEMEVAAEGERTIHQRNSRPVGRAGPEPSLADLRLSLEGSSSSTSALARRTRTPPSPTSPPESLRRAIRRTDPPGRRHAPGRREQ